MAYINLSSQANELPERRYQETMAAGTAGDVLILDSLKPGESATVSILISSGSGYVQYTNEDIATILAGNATWTTWSLGTVSASSYGEFSSAITAVRPYRSSGTIKFCVSV